MSARRYVLGCGIAAAAVITLALAATAWANHESSRAHRRAKGTR